ncbi:hypothetical protein HK414_05255 [Ramlibacter terrae]|uniref:Calcium-binding protein n=1 Tax=Ramlibacter terrae TaxID=2732511 RepID=A0ABX6P2V8_9BURK|nr:hypothetical protein HK414_05255 [Ramlibacter terrae]
MIDGGEGVDTVGYFYYGFETALTFTSGLHDGNGVQLDPVSGLSDTLVSIERLEFSGGLGNDSVTGGMEQNFFRGNGGDDTMTGGGGDDVFAFVPNDELSGNDRITDLGIGDARTSATWACGSSLPGTTRRSWATASSASARRPPARRCCTSASAKARTT